MAKQTNEAQLLILYSYIQTVENDQIKPMDSNTMSKFQQDVWMPDLGWEFILHLTVF